MCNTSVWVLDVNTQYCTVSSTGVVTRQHSNSVHAEHRLTCIVVVDVFIRPISVSNRRSVIERAGQIRLVFDKNKNVSFDLHCVTRNTEVPVLPFATLSQNSGLGKFRRCIGLRRPSKRVIDLAPQRWPITAYGTKVPIHVAYSVSNKIHGSNFIKQRSKTLWFEITKMLIAV